MCGNLSISGGLVICQSKQNSQKKMKGTKSFAIDGKIRIFAVQFYEMADELQKRQARCPSAYGPKL
jgi:hypothetical protein